jgi:hypothetical protein
VVFVCVFVGVGLGVFVVVGVGVFVVVLVGVGEDVTEGKTGLQEMTVLT